MFVVIIEAVYILNQFGAFFMFIPENRNRFKSFQMSSPLNTGYRQRNEKVKFQLIFYPQKIDNFPNKHNPTRINNKVGSGKRVYFSWQFTFEFLLMQLVLCIFRGKQ